MVYLYIPIGYIMKKILLLLLISYVGQIHGQTWQWAKSGNGSKTDEGASVATDASGNVYATGYFTSSTDIFGNDTLTNVGGQQNLFLVKYDSIGNVLWARTGTTATVGADVATDALGNVYVTGFFFSSMAVFGTDTLFNAGGTGTGNFFLVKYNSVGNVVWAKAGSCVSDVRGSRISVDLQGNIYATGFLLAPATFGTLTLSNTGIFVVKYNSSGTALWVKGESVSNTGGSFISYGIATDHIGNVYITGSFRLSNMTFGTTTLTNAGGCDIYLVKYDSSGTQLWAESEGSVGFEEAYGIATDASDNIYLTGYYNRHYIS
jgi:hypothetical protein